MNLEQISQYIKADYAILVAVLYCLGRAFRAIRKFPNQFIPLASRNRNYSRLATASP